MSSSPLPLLSDDAKDALAAFRNASPGSQRRATNLDAVRGRVSLEAPSKAAAAAGLMWPLGWGLASAAAAAGLVWGLVEVRSVEVEVALPQTEAPAVVAQEKTTRAVLRDTPSRPIAPEPRADPIPVPRPAKNSGPRPAEPSALAPAADPAPAASELREETRRLREVRASIASAAWDAAARELAAYTHAFPNGALREDAQAYRIIVRCEQGNSAKALRRAFDDRYPASPHAVRMDAACGTEKKE